MRRIEWMSDDHTLRVFALRLNHTRRYPRRTRSEKRIDWSDIIHLGVQFHLEVRPLGSVFLDEVSLRQRFVHIRRKGQAVARRAARETDVGQVWPCFIDVLAQVGFRVWRWIGRNDVEPARQILSRPARADHSCADNGDPTYGFVV